MKSAWMLRIPCLLLLGVAACVEPHWRLSPPVATSRPASEDAPTATARNTRSSSAEAGDDDASISPTSNDPQVARLEQRIAALAKRGSTTQPAEPMVAGAPASAPAEESAIIAEPAPARALIVPPVKQADKPAPTAVSAKTPEAAEQPAVRPPETATAMSANVPAPVLTNASAPKTATADQDRPASPAPIRPATPAPSASVQAEIVDIRPATNTPAVSSSSNSTAANQPAEAGKVLAQGDINSTIKRMEELMADQPNHAEDEFQLRLLYLAAGQDTKALDQIKGIDPVQAELLTAVFKTVNSTRQSILQPQNSSAEALAAVDELRRLIGQQTGVSIPRLALVTKVTSFGDYDAISPLRFKAGEDIHAYVYTEVANFRSEPTDDGRLRTLLGEKVQVFDSSGKMVWERQESAIEDRVRTPRRDFFVPFPLHLPSHLPAGEYVIKATIEDRIGGTMDQQRLSFSVSR